MRTTQIFAFLFFSVCVLVTGCNAQKAEASTFYVESWSRDNLRDQKFTVELGPTRNEYTEDVYRWNGVGYKLIFTKMPPGEKDYELEYWRVQLKEILSKGGAKKVKLGCNLLTEDGCGSGGDSFGRGDWIGDLFPRENLSKIGLLLRGQYYPIKARRVIKVKSFFVIISVNSYKKNQANPKNLDSMNVTVEFMNNFPCGEVNQKVAS